MSDQVVTTATAADLYKAVKYVLDRVQDMPNVRYYCGPGTQIFFELIQAEAAFTGRPLTEVEAARKIDTEPSYRKTRARVLVLEDQVDAMRRACECGGAHSV
jgi:hypothetical protein